MAKIDLCLIHRRQGFDNSKDSSKPIAKLEKLSRSITSPSTLFEEMLKRSMMVLPNIRKFRASDRPDDKRTVLKLVFAIRLAYDR
nr:hypothetical protein [uncultured Cohaesibacter sp.]